MVMEGSREGIQADDENEFVEKMEVRAEVSVIYAAGTRVLPITRTSSQWTLASRH